MAEPRPSVETRDVSPRALWLTGVVMALFVLASVGGLLVFFTPAVDWASKRLDKPGPVLQVAPIGDYEAFLALKRAELHDRAWVDRAAGLVQIPIEEAMRLVSEGHRAEAGIDSAGCTGGACPAATPTARTIP